MPYHIRHDLLDEFPMRRSLIRLGLALLAPLMLMSAPAHALEPGQAAPAFELPARQGSVKLADYRGKLVYLDFWASWCGPCRKSFPWMNEMQARYGARGLKVVGLNVDQKAADADTFLAQVPARFEILFDATGRTPKAYGVKAMPTSLLIAPDGRVLAIHNGFRDDQREELERAIQAALPTP